MEKTPTQHMTLIVFGGALLAAIVVALVIFFLPSIKNEEDPLIAQGDGETAPAAGVVLQTKNFNTSVLDNPQYKELDSSLFTRGLLPVAPPTGTGKTNLFR